MKNPETYLNEVALKMQSALESDAKQFVVGFKNSEIIVAPPRLSGLLDTVLRTYRRKDIEKGLTIAQWSVLGKRILDYLSQKEKK